MVRVAIGYARVGFGLGMYIFMLFVSISFAFGTRAQFPVEYGL